MRDGRRKFCLRCLVAHQTLQRLRQFAPQILRLEKQPLVKGRAVAQAEPGQKVVAV